MTDPKKQDFIHVTDPANVPVEFVSLLVAAGQANGVVNLNFATARFTPRDNGMVEPDFVMSSRLRMDLACAVQIHTELGKIIGQAQAQLQQVLATAMVSTASPGKSGKSN